MIKPKTKLEKILDFFANITIILFPILLLLNIWISNPILPKIIWTDIIVFFALLFLYGILKKEGKL